MNAKPSNDTPAHTATSIAPATSLALSHGRALQFDQPVVMGILNVTPDSFSDGGTWLSHDDAGAQIHRMLQQGADIIDVGGESTRPGSDPVTADEQIRRVIPAIQAAVAASASGRYERTIAVSIDTTSAQVAAAALDAGATILNDVSAGLHDPAMFALAARSGAPIVLMHMQGRPKTMQADPHYIDVVKEVRNFLLARAAAAMAAGIKQSQIVLDPGIGFGKTREHNLKLLAHLDGLVATGYPVLLGTSRKRFMGSLCRANWEKATDATTPPTPPEPATLVGATCATTALGVAQGVQLFRVHDVMANRQAADVAWAIRQHR